MATGPLPFAKLIHLWIVLSYRLEKSRDLEIDVEPRTLDGKISDIYGIVKHPRPSQPRLECYGQWTISPCFPT